MYAGAGEDEQNCETYHPPGQHLRNYAALLGGKGALGGRARRRLASLLEGECRAPSHRGSQVGVR